MQLKWPAFKITVPGKFVLAGEHSVLRGAMAIAMPHPEFKLMLSFEPGDSRGDSSPSVEPPEAGVLIHELLKSLQDEREGNDQSFRAPLGQVKIESSIPISAGLGSSAALCVALTRWVSGPFEWGEEQVVPFARHLEDRFHGRSSGMDVAAVAAGSPISFSLQGGGRALPLKKLPRFSFHDTGLRASTRACVAQVQEIHDKNPTLGMRLDEAMGLASRQILSGLMEYDAGTDSVGLGQIKQGIDQAHDCFERWGLVPDVATEIRERLLSQGALAAKLTGAGGGGFVMALWPTHLGV